MQLGPSFQESLPPTWQLSSSHFNYINGKHNFGALIVRVQMRPMMAGPALGIHRDPNSKEARYFRHALVDLGEFDNRLISSL
jgi:hypothetical protein